MSRPIVPNGHDPTASSMPHRPSDRGHLCPCLNHGSGRRATRSDKIDMPGHGAAGRLYCPDSHVFVDDYTGISLNRPQFRHLRDLVHQRLVQAVLCMTWTACRASWRISFYSVRNRAGRVWRCGLSPCPMAPRRQKRSCWPMLGASSPSTSAPKILERTARGRRGRAQAGHTPYGRPTLGYIYVKHADNGAYYYLDKNQCLAARVVIRGTKDACYVSIPRKPALVRRIFLSAQYRAGTADTSHCRAADREGIPTPFARSAHDRRHLESCDHCPYYP